MLLLCLYICLIFNSYIENNNSESRLIFTGQLRVIRDQIRGLLDEDKEAEEAAALHAGCPSQTAAKDNTIIAVDPAHFTPADPREVVAEFYDAIADWTSGGMKGDLRG